MNDQSDMNVMLKLGEISGKLDSLITQVTTHEKDLSLVEVRVRTLENNKYLLLGLAAASGGAMAKVVTLFT